MGFGPGRYSFFIKKSQGGRFGNFVSVNRNFGFEIV